MTHDWRPDDPHIEDWFVGDRLRNRYTGKEYTLLEVREGSMGRFIRVDGPDLDPGVWTDTPYCYDNLSEEERASKEIRGITSDVLKCFKSHDGSAAIRWDLELGRKRITSTTTKPWVGKTVVLNDIFGPGFSDELLDMLFKKIILLSRTQFVILTEHPDRMNEYMRRIWGLAESGYWERPVWLKYFSWFEPWRNIWFGISVRSEIDVEKVAQLTRMPSNRRFIVLETRVPLRTEWIIPKCKRCNGRGSYLFSITGPAVACNECPGWDLPGAPPRPGKGDTRAYGGNILRDRRQLGGEINWVVVPHLHRLDTQSLNSVVASERQYGTVITAPGLPKRFRGNPL